MKATIIEYKNFQGVFSTRGKEWSWKRHIQGGAGKSTGLGRIPVKIFPDKVFIKYQMPDTKTYGQIIYFQKFLKKNFQ